jgi:transposase
MGYIQGEGRNQGTLFPVVLDDFVPADHMCRVIDAFVNKLAMSDLGCECAQAAETGRPGYDPRDLLKLYLYGYLNQIRSSGRLEAECRRIDLASGPAYIQTTKASRSSAEYTAML